MLRIFANWRLSEIFEDEYERREYVMKIGDKVRSTKVRPNDIATITKAHVDIKDKVKKSGGIKKEIHSKYEAEYSDGSKLIFYGFDIDRFVFRADDEVDAGQMSLEQFMEM